MDAGDVGVGQAFAAALVGVGEFGVVEAELLEECGVKFADGDGLLGDFVAEVVCLAVGQAGLEASACDECREGVAIVIAAVFTLGDRQASEFANPEDDRVFEQSRAFEILDQCCGRLVDVGRHRADAFIVFVVRVPGVAIDLVIEQRHEADATLQQASGHEATAAVGAGGGVVDAVPSLRGLGFSGQVHGCGDFLADVACKGVVCDSGVEF